MILPGTSVHRRGRRRAEKRHIEDEMQRERDERAERDGA